MQLIHENFDKSVDMERRIADYRLKESFNAKVFEENDKVNKKSSVKKWYSATHPEDAISVEDMDPEITFEKAASYVASNGDIDRFYDEMGVHDSFVRELIFRKLAEIYGVSYDDVYETWMGDKHTKFTRAIASETDTKIKESADCSCEDKKLEESDDENIYRVTYKASDYVFSSFMIKADSKEDAIDKAMKYRQDKYGKSTDIVGAEKMSASEVEDYKQRGMSLIECDTKTECVTEELHEDVGAEEIPASPETGDAMAVANSLNALIQDEWQAIDGYNSTISTYRSMKDDEYAPKDKTIDYEAIIKILEDIAQEEMNHVGMLQKAMQSVSPNVEEIKGGEEEAEEVLDVPQEVEETEEVTD